MTKAIAMVGRPLVCHTDVEECPRFDTQSFPTRDSVLAAEESAIRSENPRFNIERYLGGDAK